MGDGKPRIRLGAWNGDAYCTALMTGFGNEGEASSSVSKVRMMLPPYTDSRTASTSLGR